MAKEGIRFEDFLMGVDAAFQQDVSAIDGYLLEHGCKRKIEAAKSGTRASYSAGKRALLNFVFRKSGLLARVYGDHVSEYADVPSTLPESMLKTVAKSGDCKQLTIGPEACSPTCTGGCDFTVNGQRYQKCRYSCFFFPVNAESLPFIKTLLEKELATRT